MDRARIGALLAPAAGDGASPSRAGGRLAHRRGPGRPLRRRAVVCAAGAATAAVIAVAIPAGATTLGHRPGPAALHRAAAATVYAAYDHSPSCASCSAVIPVSTATNTAGKPIKVGSALQIAITPDGKTAYVLSPATENGPGTVTPINTATNTAGKPIPIPVGRSRLGPWFIAITPNGKTVYVADTSAHTVVPVSTATNTAGKPIPVTPDPVAIAITPDGKTAYVVSEPTHDGQSGTVTPISTATNTAGRPIPVAGVSFEIAITPDGKTAYAYSGSTVTPINTATNTAGTPIHLNGNGGEGTIAITPDGKTLYALTINPNRVVPISTATNTAGTPIKVFIYPWLFADFAATVATQLVITPDGKTLYLATGGDSVIAISTATNTVRKRIPIRPGCLIQPSMGIAITPGGKTAYVTCQNAVVPISIATNTSGKHIPMPFKNPDAIAITP
jgi:DNA-binding beta-propeller fold protein YncE